jgi:hypothetical protein
MRGRGDDGERKMYVEKRREGEEVDIKMEIMRAEEMKGRRDYRQG